MRKVTERPNFKIVTLKSWASGRPAPAGGEMDGAASGGGFGVTVLKVHMWTDQQLAALGQLRAMAVWTIPAPRHRTGKKALDERSHGLLACGAHVVLRPELASVQPGEQTAGCPRQPRKTGPRGGTDCLVH